MHVQDISSGQPGKPHALTAADSQQRFADYVLDADRGRLIAVCEDHSKQGQEPTNSIAAIGGSRVNQQGAALLAQRLQEQLAHRPSSFSGELCSSKQTPSRHCFVSQHVSLLCLSLCTPDLETGAVTQLASGHDFYSSPSLSPDGNLLTFVAWDHPNMPWDVTFLYLAAFDEKGLLQEPRYVVVPIPD